MIITKHARIRMLERTNIPNQNIEYAYQVAFDNGYKVERFSGEFYEYLLNMNINMKAYTIKVYQDNVYVFENNKKKAITMFCVPEQYMPIEKYLNRSKKHCVVKVDEIYFASNNGIVNSIDEATIFVSRQKAINFIKNNEKLENKNIEIFEF